MESALCPCLTSYTFGVKRRGGNTEQERGHILYILAPSLVIQSGLRVGYSPSTRYLCEYCSRSMTVVRSLRWIIWGDWDKTSHTTVDILFLVCSDMDSGEVIIFETRRISAGILRSVGIRMTGRYSLSITSAHKSLALITVF